MGKLGSFSLVSVLLLVSLVVSASEMVLVNETGYTIFSVRLAPSGSDHWSANVLAPIGRVRNLQELPIAIARGSTVDVLLVDGDDDRYFIPNVSAGVRIVVTQKDRLVPPTLYTLTIENLTGAVIESLWIKPSVSDVWKPYPLDQALRLFDRTEVQLNDDYRRYDLRLVGVDSREFIKRSVMLPASEFVRITRAYEQDQNRANLLLLINRTGSVLSKLFISCSNEGSWGEDSFGRLEVLGPREQLYVHLEPGKTYDIRAVDTAGRTYVRWRIPFDRETFVVLNSN